MPPKSKMSFSSRGVGIVDPRHFADLFAWYDTRDISGLAPGATTTPLRDRSDAGRDLSPFNTGGGVGDPTFELVEGRPVIRAHHSGTQVQAMRYPFDWPAAAFTEWTAVWVGSVYDAATSEVAFGPVDFAGVWGQAIFKWHSQSRFRSDAGGGPLTLSEPFVVGRRYIVVGTGNANGSNEVYVNGRLHGSLPIGGALNWGGLDDGYLAFSGPRVYHEVGIYYSRKLRPFERRSLEYTMAAERNIPLEGP